MEPRRAGRCAALVFGGVAQFAFFYQPLFWRLRRQVRLCQDFLADARAAEQGAAVEDYAEYLLVVAHRRLTAPPSPAMGFGDRRSNLYCRVLMLVESREPLDRRCRAGGTAFSRRRPWRWRWAHRVYDSTPTKTAARIRRCSLSQRNRSRLAATGSGRYCPARRGRASRSRALLIGRVIEHDTGKAIESATIIVRRRELGPGGNRVLQESLHQADAEGAFTFVISSEQLANRWLYVEFDVEHPGFASQTGMGCAIDALRNRKPLDARPYFEEIALRRGEEVTGVLETYAGRPATGVDVLAYSQGEGKPWEYRRLTAPKPTLKAASELRSPRPAMASSICNPRDCRRPCMPCAASGATSGASACRRASRATSCGSIAKALRSSAGSRLRNNRPPRLNS